MAVYGLDVSHPSQMQPELLDEYHRISKRWQEWLGFREKEVVAMKVAQEAPTTPRKRARETDPDVPIVDLSISLERQRIPTKTMVGV
jgi:hypothetical protein